MKIDFSKYSSVKIGGIFDICIIDENVKFDGKIIGKANNILISPHPPKLGILSDKFSFIKTQPEILIIGAKTTSSAIFNFAKRNNIKGFEFLCGIPGTLGGLLTMNAGLLGFEISKNLLSVRTNLGEFSKDELKFAYRKSEIKGVILEAKFRANLGFESEILPTFINARKNQPRGASFGSCFKNGANFSAGKLLDECDLRGFKIGNCGFSDKHANFLINYGGGTFDEAINLINLAKKRVFERFGVELETEVVIL